MRLLASAENSYSNLITWARPRRRWGEDGRWGCDTTFLEADAERRPARAHLVTILALRHTMPPPLSEIPAAAGKLEFIALLCCFVKSLYAFVVITILHTEMRHADQKSPWCLPQAIDGLPAAQIQILASNYLICRLLWPIGRPISASNRIFSLF